MFFKVMRRINLMYVLFLGGGGKTDKMPLFWSCCLARGNSFFSALLVLNPMPSSICTAGLQTPVLASWTRNAK